MRLLSCLLILTLAAAAQTPPAVALSKRIKGDPPLTVDPASPLWKRAPSVTTEISAKGEATPGHKTEIRSRWTDKSIYLLFICPYEQLNLLPGGTTEKETNRLWNYDVAEVFIGADFEKIWQYREYQVSPRGEWVDLDIDRKQPKPQGGWLWNSGFTVAARIDETNKIWYGAMKIPIASVTEKPVKPGTEFRANFYRIQGPAPKKFIAWRPTGPSGNHHIPEAFGILRLVK